MQAWDGMSLAVSTLDVLSAFARFAQTTDGPTCMPEFSEAESEFAATAMWHPALAHSCAATTAIPTDITLGSPGSDTHAAPALLLTGPNMVRPCAAESRSSPYVGMCCMCACASFNFGMVWNSGDEDAHSCSNVICVSIGRSCGTFWVPTLLIGLIAQIRTP